MELCSIKQSVVQQDAGCVSWRGVGEEGGGGGEGGRCRYVCVVYDPFE